ncbi:MAG TPA: phosphotransferase [Bacteroidia bacterium]|nr:phosphotransferase [Bacteroidia bacterium]
MFLFKLINKIKKKLSPEFKLDRKLLSEITERYSKKPHQFKLIRQSNNYIFEVEPFEILRLSPSVHQSYETVLSELEWILFVHSHGVKVVKPLLSTAGKLVEKIEYGNDYYTAVLFEKAKGVEIGDKESTPDVFFKMGTLTGQLHAITKLYNPSPSVMPRKVWHSAEPDNVKKCLPAAENHLYGKFTNYLSVAMQNTQHRNNFGVVHNDISRGNMLLNDGGLTLFDFEDCCYSWFVNDIAGIFYYVLLNNKKDIKENLEYLQHFMENFWRGYKSANQLNPDEIKYIPYWMGARAIFIYAYLNKIWDFKNLEPHQKNYVGLNKLFVHYDFSELSLKIP